MLAQVVRNQDDELEIVNLAGAQSDGLPLGSIIPLHTTRVPSGFLPCNGTSFDRTQYPSLYTLLGTDVLPDLRELVLVGAGQNTSYTITAHDVYSVGQFKDNAIPSGTTGPHGKQYGVFYVIKAVTGKIDVDDAAVYREIETLLESNYLEAPEKDTFTDGILLKYDKDNDKLVAITAPTSNNQVMVSNVSTATLHDYYYSLDGANYYRANETPAVPPATAYTTSGMISNGVVLYVDNWYYTDGNDWYNVAAFTPSSLTLGTVVTDQSLIDALDAETTGTLSVYDWQTSTPSVDYTWGNFALNGICAECGMYTASVEACATSSASSVEVNAQDINVCGVLNACTCVVTPETITDDLTVSCTANIDDLTANCAYFDESYTCYCSCTGWASACTQIPNKGEIADMMSCCQLACIWSSGNTLYICSI